MKKGFRDEEGGLIDFSGRRHYNYLQEKSMKKSLMKRTNWILLIAGVLDHVFRFLPTFRS
jgi:hypothetical protein